MSEEERELATDHGRAWHQGIMDLLEARGYSIVADLPRDCCFWAAHESLLSSHSVRCTAWDDVHMSSILAQVGARRTSQAVHRPLTLSLRHKERKAAQRFRSQAGQQRRNEKKALKGFGPLANKRPHSPGRSSGSQAKHGRSSGSSEEPQW